MTLFEETIKVLNNNGKDLEDILEVFGNDFKISLNDFVSISKKTIYDNGYGSQEVATDLTLLGKDFWLVRKEYDGSEKWDFITKPIAPSEIKKVSLLHDSKYGYKSLKEINEREKN